SAWPCRRAARSSGQRSLPLVVDPWPSVMESPKATTTAALADAATSTPDRKYQCSSRCAAGKSGADTGAPGARYETACEPGWPVCCRGADSSCIEMARFDNGAAGKSKASEVYSAPAGISTSVRSSNVNGRSEAGSMRGEAVEIGR